MAGELETKETYRNWRDKLIQHLIHPNALLMKNEVELRRLWASGTGVESVAFSVNRQYQKSKGDKP